MYLHLISVFSVGNNVRFVLLCAQLYVPAFKPYKIHFPSYTFSIVIVKDAILVGSRFVAFTIFCNQSPCNVSMRACCLCVYVCMFVRLSRYAMVLLLMVAIWKLIMSPLSFFFLMKHFYILF